MTEQVQPEPGAPGPDDVDDRLARVALGCLVEPGDHQLGALVRRDGARQALHRLLADDKVPRRLRGVVLTRLGGLQVGAETAAVYAFAEAVLRRTEQLGARVVTPADAEWPAQVDELADAHTDDDDRQMRDTDPPIVFWARGAPSVAEALSRSVAIVGARACTPYGEHVATDFAYGLAGRGWTVVSGGALGIDARAHRATLATGGVTVAVLACGIDRPYPVSHTSLFEQIADEGLLLTEWPLGAAPHRVRFLTRNRVIAAATKGTVMVEAGARSGAGNTLTHARRVGRPAMVVPGPVTSAMSVGCHAELRRPGTVLVSRFDEVIEEIGAIGELASRPWVDTRRDDRLDVTAKRLLDATPHRKTTSAEEIAAVAGVSGRDARRTMPLLVATGFVVAAEGGYRLAPPKRVKRAAQQ